MNCLCSITATDGGGGGEWIGMWILIQLTPTGSKPASQSTLHLDGRHIHTHTHHSAAARGPQYRGAWDTCVCESVFVIGGRGWVAPQGLIQLAPTGSNPGRHRVLNAPPPLIEIFLPLAFFRVAFLPRRRCWPILLEVSLK